MAEVEPDVKVEAASPPVRQPGALLFVSLLVLSAIGLSVIGYFASEPLIANLSNAVTHQNESPEQIKYLKVAQVGFALLGFLLGLGLFNLAWTTGGRALNRWDRTPSAGKVTLIVAIFLGLVASVPFLFFLFTLLSGNLLVLALTMLALMIGFSTLSVFILHSIDEVLPWNRGDQVRRSGLKVLDTNVIIDGRILDVVRTGFLSGPYYVPGFVLDELQYIADSPDPLRRQRGRRGLDVLRNLQSEVQLDIRVHDRLSGSARAEVDQRLVKLARALGADIVTNDFNLNRVAALQGIQVLNINDLALAMRPNVLPTERLNLAIIREGSQINQGIGYLDDGTMVVVEGGKRLIGSTVDVVVTQVIQTERGKMIFAVPMGDDEDGQRRSRRAY